MEIQSITPELKEKGLRLDKVILNHMPDRSRTEIQKWIKAGQVIVNDNVEKANYKVEVTYKEGGVEKTVYTTNFDPSKDAKSDTHTVLAAQNGTKQGISGVQGSVDRVSAKLY